MSEDVDSNFNLHRNEKSQPNLKVEIQGRPSQKVVQAVKRAVLLAMELNNWDGAPPKVAITDGYVIDKYAGRVASIYEFDNKRVVIGQALLRTLIYKNKQVPDEAIAALAAAEETTHYVQDMQGRLPHEPYLKGSETPEEHYTNHDYEAEALRISEKVVTTLYPQYHFSRDDLIKK